MIIDKFRKLYLTVMAQATVEEMPQGFVDPASKQFRYTTKQHRWRHEISTCMATYAYHVHQMYMTRFQWNDFAYNFSVTRNNNEWEGGNREIKN